MRLDKPRLLDPDSAITREIAKAFPDADGYYQGDACEDVHVMPGSVSGWACTRPVGHDGPHVASDDAGPRAVWPQEAR